MNVKQFCCSIRATCQNNLAFWVNRKSIDTLVMETSILPYSQSCGCSHLCLSWHTYRSIWREGFLTWDPTQWRIHRRTRIQCSFLKVRDEKESIFKTGSEIPSGVKLQCVIASAWALKTFIKVPEGMFHIQIVPSAPPAIITFPFGCQLIV
jgi:hypothetical protein